MKPDLTQPALDAELIDALAQAIAPVELSSQERSRMRDRILKRAAASPPSGMLTLRTNEGAWQTLAPGFSIKILRVEQSTNTRSYLVRMEAGSSAPVHSHTQEEHCLVLEGEVTIGEHIMRAGDWHVALPGTTHVDFRTKTGCLLFIRAEIPSEPQAAAPR
jgi:quercetin dioxygenase-like cupin family protein